MRRASTSAFLRTDDATARMLIIGMWIGLWKKSARRPVRAPAKFPVVENRVRIATVEVTR